MKVVFLSNYYNHHQSSFSLAMDKLTNGNFYFIETAEMPKERIILGYNIEKPNFVLQNYLNDEDKQKCQNIIDLADVVIWGSAPYNLLKTRLKAGKLTIACSERLYKSNKKFLLRFIKQILINHRFKYNNFYLLCASAYTSADYAKTYCFLNRAYKWGYFPPVELYYNFETILKSKKQNSILWSGRMLDWKHPEAAIEVAKLLKNDGYNFHLNVVGGGEQYYNVVNLVSEYGLENEVSILGTLKTEELRAIMEQSQIFLFTSDRNEGWGAVLNESMNSGCAVVASHAIGSVPFLLQDGKNGFIYKDGDINDLFNKVKYLLDNEAERINMQKSAYETIINEWNAENAAKKLIELLTKLLNGEKVENLFESSVCSKAKILKDNWM